jgi:hypothetical protein
LNKLISSKVIKKEKLPENFKRFTAIPKGTFAQIASRDIPTLNSVLSNYQDEILEYQSRLNLDYESALLCFFCETSMDIIYRESITEVQRCLKDIEFLNEIIKEITEKELIELRKVDNFSNLNKRTENIAFSILFSHYEFTLPAVEKWVPGVYDYLKIRGWKSAGIRDQMRKFKSEIEKGINNILSDLKVDEIDNYRSIKDWRIKSINKKSISLCFKILYAKFGFVLPEANKWPIGMGDYCKSNKWLHKRVYSAFFS